MTSKKKLPKALRLVKMPATHATAVRRVLRLVDGYLAIEGQDVLRTDGRGLMTYRELRLHIKAALKLVPTRKQS